MLFVATADFMDEDENKMTHESIFFHADDFKKAMDLACQWFGEDNIESISFRSFEDIPLVVDEDFIRKYLDEGGQHC